MIKLLPPFLLMFVLAAFNTKAAVIVNYDFKGPSVSGTTASSSATVVGAYATALEAKWYGYGSAGSFSQSTGSAYVQSSSQTPSDLATAVSEGKYLEITVSATSGYLLNLTSLSFDLGGSNTSTTADYTVYGGIRSDAEATDFSTDLTFNTASTVASKFVPANTSGAASIYSTFSSDLSGAQYQNLNSITLRVYIYDNSSANLVPRIGQITINGDMVAIPEPKAAALLIPALLIGASLMAIRRSGLCAKRA